eukprot:scaffold34924_cov125-Amphora_coffeaeformis.AAC.6
MNPRIEKVVSLNATCVHFLTRGCFKAAYGVLRTAIEELKQSSEVVSSTGKGHGVLCVVKTKVGQDIMSNDVAADSEVVLFAFNVIFDEVYFEKPMSISNEDVHLLSASLLFNMAFLHHCKSICCARTRLTDARKALSVYQFVTAACEKIENASDDSLLLGVATGNNMCCVLHDIGAYDMLEGCVDWTFGKAEQIVSESSIFWSNVLVWQEARHRPASAA